MKKNIGNADRFTRVILGIILLILFISGVFDNKIIGWVVFGISMILIITSFVTFCPLYALLGKSTCEVKKRK